jgi:hypothetical protein
MKATGYDGSYYIKLKAWPGSKGQYKLTVIDFDPVDSDNNNLPGEAITVNRKSETYDHLHQSFDHFDWYKVFLTKDQTINITMSLLTHVGDIYNLSVYDSALNYLTGAFDTKNGEQYNSSNPIDSQCDIVNFTAPATDHYYVMVMPVRNPSSYDQNPFIPCNSNYKIEWDLPNQGPVKYNDITPIVMDEDTIDSSLNLNAVFKDSDDHTPKDPLTFSYEPVNANITVDIDQDTGIVTFTPLPDWNTGDDDVSFTFKAEDPMANTGPSEVTAPATLTVTPVNDGPYVVGALDNVGIYEDVEEELTETPLYDYFHDIDDDLLTFSVADNGSIPVDIDDATGIITLGPVVGWYGNELINITGTDSGGEEAHILLNVTIGHVNHEPTVVDGLTERTLEIEEDSTNVSVLVAPWFDDPDTEYTSDLLTYKVGYPLPVNVLPTMTDGNLMIIPLENWTGTETVWVVAVDADKKEAKVRLDVTVTPINDAPVVKATLPAGKDITANEGQVVEIEVKLVEDVDTNVTELQYIWYVDDVIVEGSDALLSLVTDYDPDTAVVSAGQHTVKVEVSDGALYDTVEWNLTVLNVNQGPENLVILSPKAGDKFKHNQVIEFKADNATDIDGDSLTYTWKDNATGEVLGQNQTLEVKKLKKGTHVIILEVTDGQGGSNTTTVEITVKAKPASEPGFEAAIFMVAVAIAVLVVGTGRRRR